MKEIKLNESTEACLVQIQQNLTTNSNSIYSTSSVIQRFSVVLTFAMQISLNNLKSQRTSIWLVCQFLTVASETLNSLVICAALFASLGS